MANETAAIEKPAGELIQEKSAEPAEPVRVAGGGIQADSGEDQANSENENNEEQGELSDEELNSVQPGKASPLDPDFIAVLIFALFFDLVKDPLMLVASIFLGVVIPIYGFVIVAAINVAVNVIGILVIGGWMYSKSKNFEMPDNLKQKMRKAQKKVSAKIEARIQKKIASKAFRKVLVRVGGAFALEQIPLANLFTSWTAAVVSMLF